MIVDESFIDFAGDQIPSLLAGGRPIFESADRAQHEQALRRARPAPGILLQRESLRSQPAAPLHSHLESEHAGAIFPVAVAGHRRRLSRGTQAADRRRALALQRLREIPALDVYPTGANFVLFKIKNGMTATELQARLLDEHQMYVRDCSNKVGMDDFHIRVASQGREKDARWWKRLQILTR